MRLRLLNLTYLVMAIIAVGWVVSDLYSAYSASVLTGATGTVWSEGSISAFFNIPIVAGFLIVLFAVYKYPEHTREQKRKKHKKSSAQTRINAVSPSLKQTSEKKPKV